MTEAGRHRQPRASSHPDLAPAKILKHRQPIRWRAAFAAIFEMVRVGLNIPDKFIRHVAGECFQKDGVTFIAGKRGSLEAIRFAQKS
jgi:hypothetical protein